MGGDGFDRYQVAPIGLSNIPNEKRDRSAQFEEAFKSRRRMGRTTEKLNGTTTFIGILVHKNSHCPTQLEAANTLARSTWWINLDTEPMAVCGQIVMNG